MGRPLGQLFPLVFLFLMLSLWMTISPGIFRSYLNRDRVNLFVTQEALLENRVLVVASPYGPQPAISVSPRHYLLLCRCN